MKKLKPSLKKEKDHRGTVEGLTQEKGYAKGSSDVELPSDDDSFVQEVGVHPSIQGPDADEENPLGDEYGRRNYGESGYLSGEPELEPNEYRKGMPRYDLYKDYFDRKAPTETR